VVMALQGGALMLLVLGWGATWKGLVGDCCRLIFMCLGMVVLGVVMVALGIAWVVEVTWRWRSARRARKREVMAAGRAALGTTFGLGDPLLVQKPEPVLVQKSEPVLARHWADELPDDLFTPPLNWRLRKKFGLPARALPPIVIPTQPTPTPKKPKPKSWEMPSGVTKPRAK
jgi:hypothetical protein